MGGHLRRVSRVISLTVAASLTVPTTVLAATFGADLNNAPTNTVTCGDGVFPYYSAPMGSQSCLYFSGSAVASPYAPVSGTVTAVHVRVGPVTGPMQIVVMRSLYQNKAGDPGHPYFACCFVERYGPTFTPEANTVATVKTNLPMTEEPTPPPEDFSTNAAGDFLALSVLAPNVPIPATTDAQSGYSGFYPAPTEGTVTAPSPNPLFASTDGTGVQILISGDLEGGGGAGGSGTKGADAPANPTPTPPALQQIFPSLVFPKLTLPVSKGRVALPLQCTGANCIGNVLLQNAEQPGATIARAKKRKGKKHLGVVIYGSAAVNIPAGAKGTVTLKLNATGKKATKGHKSVKAWANFMLGSTKLSKPITLRG